MNNRENISAIQEGLQTASNEIVWYITRIRPMVVIDLMHKKWKGAGLEMML